MKSLRIKLLFFFIKLLYPEFKQVFLVGAYKYQGGVGFKMLDHNISPCGSAMRDILDAAKKKILEPKGSYQSNEGKF